MTAIWQSVEFQRIGWALLHSLWQGAAICALAAVLLRLIPFLIQNCVHAILN